MPSIDAGERVAGAWVVVVWHKNWLKSDASLLVPGVVNDGTDCGTVVLMDCGGNQG